MLKNKRYIGFITISIIMFIFLIYMGTVDGFRHGYYSDEIETDQIAEQDWYDIIDLSQEYQMIFSPCKNHFAGISIFLKNQPEGNAGTLNMEIEDTDGNFIEKNLWI